MAWTLRAAVCSRNRSASASLTKDEIVQIRATLDQACGTQNLARSETLLDFHRLLAHLGGNSVWSLLSNSINLIFSDHVIASTDSSAFHEVAEDDHKKIAQAIIAGKPALARKHMLAHTERMIKFYRAQTPSIFSRLIEWR